MKYAVVKNGIVQNIIEAEQEFADSISAVPFVDGCEIGGKYDGNTFTPVPVTVPETPFPSRQESKIKLLSAMCKQAIIGGFDSDALGDIHHYPAAAEDQTNLLSRVVQAQLNASNSKWTAVLSCQDSKGNWRKVSHSAKQVISVAADATQDVQDKTAQYTALSAQVTSAKTDADVAAVSWVYPPKA